MLSRGWHYDLYNTIVVQSKGRNRSLNNLTYLGHLPLESRHYRPAPKVSFGRRPKRDIWGWQPHKKGRVDSRMAQLRTTETEEPCRKCHSVRQSKSVQGTAMPRKAAKDFSSREANKLCILGLWHT